MKNEGKDILDPMFSDASVENKPPPERSPKEEIVMTKPGIDRKITPEELKAQDKEKPWVSDLRVSWCLVSFDDSTVCCER